jgi:hypothetical protein
MKPGVKRNGSSSRTASAARANATKNASREEKRHRPRGLLRHIANYRASRRVLLGRRERSGGRAQGCNARVRVPSLALTIAKAMSPAPALPGL